MMQRLPLETLQHIAAYIDALCIPFGPLDPVDIRALPLIDKQWRALMSQFKIHLRFDRPISIRFVHLPTAVSYWQVEQLECHVLDFPHFDKLQPFHDTVKRISMGGQDENLHEPIVAYVSLFHYFCSTSWSMGRYEAVEDLRFGYVGRLQCMEQIKFSHSFPQLCNLFLVGVKCVAWDTIMQCRLLRKCSIVRAILYTNLFQPSCIHLQSLTLDNVIFIVMDPQSLISQITQFTSLATLHLKIRFVTQSTSVNMDLEDLQQLKVLALLGFSCEILSLPSSLERIRLSTSVNVQTLKDACPHLIDIQFDS